MSMAGGGVEESTGRAGPESMIGEGVGEAGMLTWTGGVGEAGGTSLTQGEVESNSGDWTESVTG